MGTLTHPPCDMLVVGNNMFIMIEIKSVRVNTNTLFLSLKEYIDYNLAYSLDIPGETHSSKNYR